MIRKSGTNYVKNNWGYIGMLPAPSCNLDKSWTSAEGESCILDVPIYNGDK